VLRGSRSDYIDEDATSVGLDRDADGLSFDLGHARLGESGGTEFERVADDAAQVAWRITDAGDTHPGIAAPDFF
jgi:hypothetical protein